MKRKIEIEIENASVYDLDALTFGLNTVVKDNVKNFNSLNNSNMSVSKVGYVPIVHESIDPVLCQIERKAEELYPVEIVKKKDKSKPLKAAYIKGASDVMDLMEKHYRNGMHPDDIFGTNQETKEPAESGTFGFQEAISALMSGKKVRRASWNKNLYIVCNSDKSIVRLFNHTDTGDDLLHIDERFTFSDITAEDWELYKG